MKGLVGFVLGALLAATGLVLADFPSRVDGEESSREERSSPTAGGRDEADDATGSGRDGPAHPIELAGKSRRLLYNSEDLVQIARFDRGKKGLVFDSCEKLPGDGLPSLATTNHFATSYELVDVVHSGQANLFYVLGRGRGGESIVERWEIAELEGGFFARRPASSQPVGVPLPGVALQTGIEGGVWQYPVDRSSAVTSERVELYRGKDYVAILDLAADPDGRFVIALVYESSQDRTIVRIDADPQASSTPVELIDAQAHGVGHVSAISLKEASTGDRVLVLSALGPPEPVQAMMIDPENDGLFDPPQVFPASVWAELGLDRPESWGSNFVDFF